MKATLPLIVFFSFTTLLFAQKSNEPPAANLPKHYISVNPLNILLFQQIGITYEFNPGIFGYGLTTGYIYPNEEEYSNYFIAGPTDYASLGWYSGWFIVPQINMYLTKPKNIKHTGLLYASYNTPQI